MNPNAVEYDYLSEIVSGNLKQLRLAITGRRARPQSRFFPHESHFRH